MIVNHQDPPGPHAVPHNHRPGHSRYSHNQPHHNPPPHHPATDQRRHPVPPATTHPHDNTPPGPTRDPTEHNPHQRGDTRSNTHPHPAQRRTARHRRAEAPLPGRAQRPAPAAARLRSSLYGGAVEGVLAGRNGWGPVSAYPSELRLILGGSETATRDGPQDANGPRRDTSSGTHPCQRGPSPAFPQVKGPLMAWRHVDSNHGRLSRRIYSPLPLATRAYRHGTTSRGRSWSGRSWRRGKRYLIRWGGSPPH